MLRETAKSILEIEELEDGFAYRFPADDVWLTKLNEFIHFERQCCPFLTFKLIIKPDNGPIWLQLTGPVGVKEFLSSLFS